MTQQQDSGPTGQDILETTPGPESAQGGQAQALETPPKAEATPPVTPDPEALRAYVESLDPDEVLRLNRRVAGKVGDLAQKQARQLADEQHREWLEKQAQAELTKITEERRRLRKEDPIAYAEYDEELERKQQETQRQIDVLRETWTSVDQQLLHKIFYSLPEADQKELGGKKYEGNEIESRLAFLQDMIDRSAGRKAEDRLAKERERWEREERPALQKEANAAAVANEGSPDLGGGQRVSTPRYTREQVAKMSAAEFVEASKHIWPNQ